MKLMKSLLAFLALVLLLGGVPMLLLAWGRPLALLDVAWSSALVRPDDGTIVFGVLSVVGWVAWIVVAVSSIVELVGHLSRQRIRLHLPGIRWLQPAIGSLVAVALAPVLSSHADEPAPPVASHAPLVVEAPEEDLAPRVADKPLRKYVVQAGDEIWGIAERELGQGAQWRTVLTNNPGMTADTVLAPGDAIWLPAPTSLPDAQQAPAPLITVEEGDTLWHLSEEHLGDPQRWPELYDANRHRVLDPDEIDVGWLLSLPAETTEANDATPRAEAPPDSSPEPSLPSVPQTNVTESDDSDESAVTHHPQPETIPGAETSTEALPEAVAVPHASPTPKPSSPLPTSHAQEIPTTSGRELDDTQTPSLTVLGPMGGALAASVVVGVAARRQMQLLHRGLGTRSPALTPSLQRFFSALVHKAATGPPEPEKLGPTSVVVGWTQDVDIHIDLEHERCTLIDASPADAAGMTAAILTSLLCAEWSESVEVVAVQPSDDWASVLEDPRLSGEDDLQEALTHLQRLCSQRRLQLGADTLLEARSDPDRSDVWAPVVFVFCHALQEAHMDRIHDCLSLGQVGVSVVAAARRPASDHSPVALLEVQSEDRATLNDGPWFQPQLLNQPARHAVMSLFASASDQRTEPAPWWRDGEETAMPAQPPAAASPSKDGAMSAWSTQPAHPTLLLLGSVELQGCSGELPARAVGQCMEYCAWLLLNPGASPTTMVRELLVAETTRRSNMSRLRSWLGADSSGNPYLPDAYSGRIELAPSVTSDWERFQSLLAGGVNTSSTPLLKEALLLVRGMPLDGVAFQWPWATPLLSDMICMITDAAAVLADRYLTEKDYPGVLWAVSRGQLAAGDDETLTVRRIQAYAQTGDTAGVDAAVTQLTRAARADNRELSTDTVRRVQQALHLGMARV